MVPKYIKYSILSFVTAKKGDIDWLTTKHYSLTLLPNKYIRFSDIK